MCEAREGHGASFQSGCTGYDQAENSTSPGLCVDQMKAGMGDGLVGPAIQVAASLESVPGNIGHVYQPGQWLSFRPHVFEEKELSCWLAQHSPQFAKGAVLVYDTA